MSIEQTLERIAVALEKLANAPTTQSTPAHVPTSGPTPTVAQSSSGPPMAMGPVGGPPVSGPTMLYGGVPTGPEGPPAAVVEGAPATTSPSAQAPAPQVQGVPTLDDIKALANDFHRAHPERAAEFVQVLAGKNAQKLSDLPPASYVEIHGKLKEMMGQG